ncbi:hypothetical protein ABPG77_010889 [Micractinium sp. CCAP 211/92]
MACRPQLGQCPTGLSGGCEALHPAVVAQTRHTWQFPGSGAHPWQRRRATQLHLAAAASSSPPPPPPASRSVDIEEAASGSAPWKMGYQCNERYLKWDSSAQRQLVLIWVAQQLDLTLEQLEGRLAELALLLPGLDAKLGRMQAKLVLALVKDLPATSERVLHLRRLLPSLDLSALLAQYPWILVEVTPAQVESQLVSLAAALPANIDVERLVAAEPMFLRADIAAVLAELQRLVPGRDPVELLLADPSGVLDMQSAGLKASLEIDDGIPAA